MSRKYLYFFPPFLAITLILGLFLLLPARTAAAQCKDPSTCRTCHEVQGQKPVKNSGDWHSQHAAFDFCAACHGGDKKAQDKAAAHQGIALTLDQMGGTCKDCHAADTDQRYQKYAAQLGVTGAIKNTTTKDPNAALGSFLGVQPANISPPSGPAGGSSSPGTAEPAQSPSQAGNIIAAALLLVLAMGGGGYVLWNERRLHGTFRPVNLIAWARAQLCRPNWSPYAAGILLGLTAIFAVWAGNHLLGASGAVSTVTSTALNAVAPTAVQGQMYYKFVMPPGMSWEVVLLIGVFFGGLLGALSSKTFRLRWNDDSTWRKVLGTRPWKRFAIGFFGAIILQYGAGIAGGCTSGLAISGGMLLAPSAFLFMGGMFASGILVALIVYRRRY